MGSEFDSYLAWTVFRCVADQTEQSIGQCKPKKGVNQPQRWSLQNQGWPPFPEEQELLNALEWINRQYRKICKTNGFKVLPPTGIHIDLVESENSQAIAENPAIALACPLLPNVLRRNRDGIGQETAKRFMQILSEDILKQGGLDAHPISPTSKDGIINRAIRSLHDWRATLAFLSQLRSDGETVSLAEPDASVIDQFNASITHGFRPNLFHALLVHLASSARMRTIMTTNFDTLIEQAFQDSCVPVKVVPVSNKGSLPSPDIINLHNSIIKLHGEILETRADFSLDESPPLGDLQRFSQMVARCTQLIDPRKNDRSPGSRHPTPRFALLVCGYSGSDQRCVQMMKFLMDAEPQARIFWVCHNESGRRRVEHIFSETCYENRILCVVSERADLLLYEFYQRLNLTLPPGGAPHQHADAIAPSVPRPEQQIESSIKAARHVSNPSFGWFRPQQPNQESSRKLFIVEKGHGVLQFLSETCSQLRTEYNTRSVWLELEDYQDPVCMAHDLLQTIAQRLGIFQLSPSDLLPGHLCDRLYLMANKTPDDTAEAIAAWLTHLDFLLRRHFKVSPNTWMIVLYGRNGPGGCAGWNENDFWGQTDDQGASIDASYGSETAVGLLEPLIKALCAIGFHVIYSPYSMARGEIDQESYTVLSEHVAASCSGAPREKIERATQLLEEEWHKIPVHNDSLLSRYRTPINGAEPFKWIYPGAITMNDVGKAGLRDQAPQRAMISFARCMGDIAQSWLNPKSEVHYKEAYDTARRQRRARAGHFDTRMATAAYQSNVRVLYVATLFRQARHYSSFLIDGMITCPERFNRHGLDNDWIRDQQLSKMLELLRETGFFWEKLGAFAWVYRDFRYGARLLIEVASTLPGWKGHKEFPSTWRAYYHYWIGDWYLRAMLSADHDTPLLEALYHFNHSIEHVGEFRSMRTGEDQAAKGDRPASAGLHGVRAVPKGLRHGFAVACVQEKIPLSTVQKWLGHARAETTAIYLDFVGQDERDWARLTWPTSVC